MTCSRWFHGPRSASYKKACVAKKNHSAICSKFLIQALSHSNSFSERVSAAVRKYREMSLRWIASKRQTWKIFAPFGRRECRVQWYEACCPHMHLLLSQSVLSSFLGTEYENNIVTCKEAFDRKCPHLFQMKSAVIVLDNSDFLGRGKKTCCLLQPDMRMWTLFICRMKSKFLSNLSFLHVSCH